MGDEHLVQVIRRIINSPLPLSTGVDAEVSPVLLTSMFSIVLDLRNEFGLKCGMNEDLVTETC